MYRVGHCTMYSTVCVIVYIALYNMCILHSAYGYLHSTVWVYVGEDVVQIFKGETIQYVELFFLIFSRAFLNYCIELSNIFRNIPTCSAVTSLFTVQSVYRADSTRQRSLGRMTMTAALCYEVLPMLWSAAYVIKCCLCYEMLPMYVIKCCPCYEMLTMLWNAAYVLKCCLCYEMLPKLWNAA